MFDHQLMTTMARQRRTTFTVRAEHWRRLAGVRVNRRR